MHFHQLVPVREFMLRLSRLMACALAVFLMSANVHATAADAGTQKRFAMGKRGQIQLTVPAGWQDKADPSSPSFSFTPAKGTPFIVTIGPATTAAVTRDALKQEVERALDGIAPFAVEKKIEVVEIKDAAGPGFYFFATDSAPRAGEYKFMTRGALLVGKVPVAFAVLTNPGQEQVVRDAMAMLKSATAVAP